MIRRWPTAGEIKPRLPVNGPSGVLAFHYMAANRLPRSTVDICAVHKLETLHGGVEWRMRLAFC